MSDDDDDRTKAALARRDAWLTQVAAENDFDRQAVDHAVLITRFFEAQRDRYSVWHHDPVLGPIIKPASARYGEFRKYDFTLGAYAANVEAVRTILALKIDSV